MTEMRPTKHFVVLRVPLYFLGIYFESNKKKMVVMTLYF